MKSRKMRSGLLRLCASGLFIDHSSMSDFDRENDEPGVFNRANDPVVTDTIPPQPRKLSGQPLSDGSWIGGSLDVLLQIRGEG